MGGCMSVPNTSHRRRPRNNLVRPISQEESDPQTSNSKIFIRPARVLKDSAGKEIYKLTSLEKEARKRAEIDVEDVRREVEIMRNMPEHPNIVSYKDVYEKRCGFILLISFSGSGELFDRIVAKGHYTERAAALVIKTILEVVQACHNHGVMHRDLKPENFLYSHKGENASLKAIDFGLSISFQLFREIVGSPYYMAPEVLKRNYFEQIDVWSAGNARVPIYGASSNILVIRMEQLTETEEGIAQAVIKGDINFKRDPWPRVSEDAKSLVKGMLEQNPYERLTVEEALENQWIQNAHKVPNIPLGEHVRSRIQQFSLMNKFKKKVIRADLDENGVLNCEEFMMVAIHLKRISTDDNLRQAFHHFDKDKNGYIELDELRESLFEDQHSTNEKLVRDILHDADLDKDGRISYPEFAAMMTTGMDWKMASRQYSRVMLNAISVKMFKDQ
ncbi:calcium-dependent protein kinase 24-like protein [Tanacetum coccineum]